MQIDGVRNSAIKGRYKHETASRVDDGRKQTAAMHHIRLLGSLEEMRRQRNECEV